MKRGKGIWKETVRRFSFLFFCTGCYCASVWTGQRTLRQLLMLLLVPLSFMCVCVYLLLLLLLSVGYGVLAHTISDMHFSLHLSRHNDAIWATRKNKIKFPLCPVIERERDCLSQCITYNSVCCKVSQQTSAAGGSENMRCSFCPPAGWAAGRDDSCFHGLRRINGHVYRSPLECTIRHYAAERVPESR